MSDVDVIIRVHTQGVQEIGNLSASLRGLSTSLRNINVPMSRLDTSSRAVYKALGVTSRGVDNHAKSIKELVRNQKVLGAETKNITRDLNGLRNAFALAGRESTALGRAIGVSARELSGFSRTFRGMRLRAFGSDLNSISLRMTKLGKDAQFVGRSLMINLTLPLATFARIGLRSFLSIEKQTIRLVKVMENLASTTDIAKEKILGLGSAQALTPEQEIRANAMVKSFNDMNKALTDLSLKFGVSKEITVSLAADFAELGITAEENVKSITKLTLEIEKLGSMDIGPAQDLSQALFFQSKRAFEVTKAFDKLTTARAREEKAIQSSITQMYLFNAIENATALTLKDLGDSFAEISAMATSYGLSMTEAAALLAPMKAAGLDVGASANSIKVSLQRLLAPTKQNTQELQRLAERFGVAGDAQNEFAMSTKTGLVGLSSVVKMFDRVRKSSMGSEGALRLMSDLFEKRQGPRMYLAIEQLADFNNELAKANELGSGLPSTMLTAEMQLVKAADKAGEAFSNFNTTAVPKTIRSFQDIGKVARIATAFEGQVIEFEPGVKTTITLADIKNAKDMRDAVAQTVLEAKRLRGEDLISEVKTESGRALMIQLAGATNAAEVAQQELARSLSSAGVSIESLKTTFKMFAADIIASLIPTIKALSEKVQQMYDTWNSEDFAQTRATIIRLITVVGGILAILGPITLAIGTLQSVIGKFGMVVSRFVPKLKNVDGEFTRLGQSAQFAKKQINGVYDAFVKAAGLRPSALQGTQPVSPTPIGPPGPLKRLRPGSGKFLAPANAIDLPSVGNIGERTAAVQKARLAKAGLEDIAGGPTAAEQQAAFQKFLRRNPRATRYTPPPSMATSLGIPATTPALQSAFDTYQGLTPSQRSDLTPTSSRRAARRQVKAAARMVERAPVFERAGVGVIQEMGDTGSVGRERFSFRGRNINREQAETLGRGGPRAALTRAALRVQGLRSGIAARPGITAARAAMASAPSTGAGIVPGAIAGIKASTAAMVQNMSSVKGAKAAMAALNDQYKAMGTVGPGRIRMMGTAMMGFVKNLKIATLATRIFKLTLMMTGIGAIIAGVAAIIYLVIQNLDKIKGSAKVMEPLKRAFTAVKDAVFMIIRPIQDLFAQFGSGANEGERSGNAIVSAFEGIAAAVEFVAGLFKLFVEKVIQPYLYGIVNIVMAVVEMFKGNWGDAFKFLLAGVGSIVKGVINLFVGLGMGIVTIIAKAITLVLDLFGKIPIIGGVFKLASKAVNGVANAYKTAARGVADFAIKGIDKVIDMGIKKSTNSIQKNKPKVVDAAEDTGELAGEAISNAYGNADMEGASDKIAKKIKEGLKDKAQELYDFVVERFADSIKKVVTASVKALNKQKEAALKVFDIQLNTLVKLEKAEESLTRAKEYETNRRKIIDDAALRQQNYVRNRALAIYEGRIDDARILDQEERVASTESGAELTVLDDGRKKELSKENLESLKDAIKEAQDVAGRFFEESIEKFQEAAEHITRIAPVTQEQYAAQLENLRLKTVEYSDQNNLEFGTMFEKFATTISEKMPNTVDQFGQALGAFAGPLDELVNLATNKYGLGSESDNTVLGVTKQMADSVIGLTLGMLVDIGGVFGTGAPAITEKFGDVTGGITEKIGTFKTGALGSFTTLLSEVKLQFITPFKKALDEADPMTVFKNAIIDGNEEILNSFRKTLALNPDLMKKIEASLDPAIAGYLGLKAAADAAADAMDNAGGAGGDPPTLTGKGFTNVDRYEEGLIRSGEITPSRTYKNVQRNLQRARAGLYGQPQFGLPVQGLKEGGPISPRGGDGRIMIHQGLSGFLNAPEQQAIPAIMHGGEFVVNADAVRRIGLGALSKLNDSRIPKFKKGGFVGAPDRVERMALARKPSGTPAAYAGQLMTPQEKAMNFATASVGNFKRAVERAEAPVKDTRSFKQKTFDIVKGLGMVANNAAGSALDQFSKIGSQDGLIDKLTRFDKSSVDLIAGGIGRSGKILKGAYSNVLLPMAESMNATFINPYINTGGRLIGKNPNLREAGMLESALNIADLLSSVFTLGGSKVATTTGRAGLTSVLKAMAKGSVKTSDEMLAQKMNMMAMAGKFPTMASQLTPSSFGMPAALRGEIMGTADVVLRRGDQVGNVSGVMKELTAGRLGANLPMRTAKSYAADENFLRVLRNPTEVLSEFIPGNRIGVGPYNATKDGGDTATRFAGRYFDQLDGITDSPVAFGFNIENPLKAFPTLPRNTVPIQSQPFAIRDFSLDRLMRDRAFQSEFEVQGYPFVEQFMYAQSAAQHLRYSISKNLENIGDVSKYFGPESYAYRQDELTNKGLQEIYGVKPGDFATHDLYEQAFFKASYENRIKDLKKSYFEYNPYLASVVDFENLQSMRNLLFEPDQVDFIGLAALKGQPEAAHLWRYLSNLGKNLRGSLETAVKKDTIENAERSLNRRVDLDNLYFVREVDSDLPTEIGPGGRLQLRSAGQRHLFGDDEILRDTIHGSLNHIVGGHFYRNQGDKLSRYYVAAISDLVDYNPGALTNLYGVDTWFVPPPFGSVSLPEFDSAGKRLYHVFDEALEFGPGRNEELMGQFQKDILEFRKETYSYPGFSALQVQALKAYQETYPVFQKGVEEYFALSNMLGTNYRGVTHPDTYIKNQLDLIDPSGSLQRAGIAVPDLKHTSLRGPLDSPIHSGLSTTKLDEIIKQIHYNTIGKVEKSFLRSYNDVVASGVVGYSKPVGNSAGEQFSLTKEALRAFLDKQGAPAFAPGMWGSSSDVDNATGLIARDLGVRSGPHDSTASHSDAFGATGVPFGVESLIEFSRNLILKYYGTDSQFIRNYKGVFPGKYTRLLRKDFTDLESPSSVSMQKVLDQINAMKQKESTAVLVQNKSKKPVQEAIEQVFRRSSDSIAYVRDADPLDLMGNTPFIPPAIETPLSARSFSEQLEMFKALHGLATAKNAALQPYQQQLIEQYTVNFNKLLNTRSLDLSGNPLATEAYIASVKRLYPDPEALFSYPVKPNSGIPLMENMEAAGSSVGGLRLEDVLYNPEIQQMIDVFMMDMNKAMKTGSVVYPENIQTYRGLSLPAPVDDPRKYLDSLYRPGYTLPSQYASTSINEEVAKSFSSGPYLKSSNPYSSTYGRIPILEHITIPKGNEVFSPSYYGLGLQNEREIIIPPTYKLRVDNILEPDAGGNGYFRIQATAIKAAAMAGLGGVGIAGASMISTPNQAQAATADAIERTQLQKTAYYESVRRLNDFIASQETKNVSDQYNAIHSRMEPVADLTSMTIQQAIDFAKQFRLSNTESSGAIGKYQNLPEYLGLRATASGISLNSFYDEKNQELIAQSYLLKNLNGNGINLESYFSNKKTQKYAIDRIANYYRGMPGSDGRFVGKGSNKEGSDLNMLGNLKNYLTAAKLNYMPGFKEGGFVGGMPSMAIPAMLHGGEYVLNAKAVQQLGLPYLNAMNQISQSQFRPPSSRVNAPSGSVTNNVSTVNIQVENFVGEEAWFESMMEEYNINVLPKNQKLAGLEQRRFSTYNGINQGL